MKKMIPLYLYAYYLPYNLGMKFDKDVVFTLTYLNIKTCFDEQYKPVLRSLKDLNKLQEINGKIFNPLYVLINEYEAFDLSFIPSYGAENLPFGVLEMLLEWHFDVFEIEESGLCEIMKITEITEK